MMSLATAKSTAISFGKNNLLQVHLLYNKSIHLKTEADLVSTAGLGELQRV